LIYLGLLMDAAAGEITVTQPSAQKVMQCMALRHLPGWTCGTSTDAPSRFPEPWFGLGFSLASGTGRVLRSWVHQEEELLDVTGR